MLSLQRGCVPTVLVALASLLVSVLLATSSRPFAVAAVGVPMKVESSISPLATSIGVDNESERNLFELTLPFDFVNDQCASACFSQEEQEGENDEGPLINACPKCHDRYSPCNFCCYEGASSLKLRFFGCSGNTSLVFGEDLEDNGCDDSTSTSTSIVSNILDSGVQFVDCDCFDDATDVSSSSFGDIASCTLFDHAVLDHASPDIAAPYLDLCLVSTTNRGDGPVANFSHSLPNVIGLKHVPNGNTVVGDGHAVTFFETSCDEKGIDSLGNFAYPLFPGYGKFAGTCSDNGFIDFENENSRLPDDIVFLGQPPSTSFFYRFIDGTSVGFWPNANDYNDDDSTGDSLFFHPTFATCTCRDCDDVQTSIPLDTPSAAPTSDPLNPSSGTPPQPNFRTNDPSASFSDIPSHIPSTKPSTLNPSASPSSEPTTSPSLFPSESPSESPSGSFFPSVTPTNIPSKSQVPSAFPSTNPSEHLSEPPSHSPFSEVPSFNPSGYPTTFHPVTYRCPPTSAPTNANGPVTPSPIQVFNTPSPLALLTDQPTYLTESPTDYSVTSNPTETTDYPVALNPTENPSTTDEGCVDEADCFIFAVRNCVNKNTLAICIPPLNEGSRRYLEEQIRFHQAALAELQHK